MNSSQGERPDDRLSPLLVTLTTDFGLVDSYVGVMKGVMAAITMEQGCGPLQFVDVTHGIAPQDVAAGRFQLAQAVPYFPVGTVHLAVVDPGVGGKRRAIAIEFERGWLVGPDNGLFSAVLSQYPARAAVELNRPRFWRSADPSQTFHGRDIFAPAAAYLASGVPLLELGDEIPVQSLVTSALMQAEAIAKGWRGVVQHIDHFGNVVTTVKAAQVAGSRWRVEVGDLQIAAVENYSQAAPGDLVALIGSYGWVEIAVNGGSAASRLSITVGDEMILRID